MVVGVETAQDSRIPHENDIDSMIPTQPCIRAKNIPQLPWVALDPGHPAPVPCSHWPTGFVSNLYWPSAAFGKFSRVPCFFLCAAGVPNSTLDTAECNCYTSSIFPSMQNLG